MKKVLVKAELKRVYGGAPPNPTDPFLPSGLTLVTGLHNGDLKNVEAPDAAIPGAWNAFNHVIANTGGLSNLAVIVTP